MQLGQDKHPRDHGDASEDGYVINPVQLDVEPVDDQSDTESPMFDPNMTAWWTKDFIVAWPKLQMGQTPSLDAVLTA